MAGIEDNLTMIGDWNPPDPSPRTFFSSFLNDDFSRPFPNLSHVEIGNEVNASEMEKPKVATLKEKDGDVGMDISCDSILELPNPFSIPQQGSRGGLSQRMATRARFTAPKIDTAQIRSGNLASSITDVRSPYLTIPPGLSPTTLLDSPVFLSNSLAQPSPTTGKLLLGHSNMMSSVSSSSILDKSKENTFVDIDNKAFVFKPNFGSSSSYFQNEANQVASSNDHPPSLPSIEVRVGSEISNQAGSLDPGVVHHHNNQDFHLQPGFSESSNKKDIDGNFTFNQKISDSAMANENSPPLEDPQDEEEEPKGESSSMAIGAPSEDGFNWRKYGQKQVKGSEFPRSYYKCTHPNCQVKKKVERSLEGHITEIIYKGAHNHPRPPPNRRSGVGSSHSFSDMQIDGAEPHASLVNSDGKPTWANTQNGSGGISWTNDGLEATSSASIAAELCDPPSIQIQDGLGFELADAIDVSSTLSNDEDEDDQATLGSASLGCDGEGDESESKRRKLENSTMDMNAASRAVREPRVVVQTTSEVDILDDGYRWRKYGQKVVKGNPNPRSYYKCTNPGCSVRKHVERASHDLKSVITTYEGKHNHDVPVARNSSHSSSGPSSVAATTSAPQTHISHRRPETSQVQDNLPRFDGPSSLGAFTLPGRDQLGRPTGSFSFGMGQQGLANLAMSGVGPAVPQVSMFPPAAHSYLRPHHVNEAGMIPKGEPQEEPMLEAGLPMLTNSSSVYHQIMSRLPLGYQL